MGEEPTNEDRFDILVVEDDADTREMLAEVFDATCWRVRTAADLDEAEAALGERLPDVILSDLQLSACESGCTLARRLHEDPSARHVARIAITGRVQPEVEAVFDACLKKPFDLTQLVSLVTRLAGTSRERREVERLSEGVAAF